MSLGSFHEDILDAQGDRGPIFIRKPSPCLRRQKESRQEEPGESFVIFDGTRPIERSCPDSNQEESDTNQKEPRKKKNVFTRFFRSVFNFKDHPWKSEILDFIIVVFFLLVLLRLGKDEES